VLGKSTQTREWPVRPGRSFPSGVQPSVLSSSSNSSSSRSRLGGVVHEFVAARLQSVVGMHSWPTWYLGSNSDIGACLQESSEI